MGRYAAQHPVLEQLNQKLEARSDTLRRRIAVYVEKRIQRAYPEAARRQPTAVQKGKADFLSAADLLWLFVIGAFLGDMVETVFCRLTAGVWMSRSSLVWGPFSVVWGLALAMATVLLRQNQDKSDRYLFAFGTVLGGVYEYVCSAVTELLFGTVFCRLTAGVWMSRSSLVWGPFSVVWGLALAMATVLLRQNQDKSERYLFAFGTVLGGVYEYVCSAVTELLFGTVFWDYSKFKFNLGGRINLLYCFFWGIAAVMWMRYGYPLVLKLMKKGAQPYPSVDDSSAGGIHGGEYAYQRAGTGAVRCPHQRRSTQRPAGSVP